jgi:predicted DNA-binding transcriptional regulator YafY
MNRVHYQRYTREEMRSRWIVSYDDEVHGGVRHFRLTEAEYEERMRLFPSQLHINTDPEAFGKWLDKVIARDMQEQQKQEEKLRKTYDECWSCEKLLEPGMIVVEVKTSMVNNDGKSLTPFGTEIRTGEPQDVYSRQCLRCAYTQRWPGINEDNLDACAPGWKEQV